MKSVQVNPFVIGTYAGSHYFCDREKETGELVRDLTNGRNVVLIAQRRMGKTGLILHTFHQEEISKNYNILLIDIFATASIREFVYAFGSAIIDQLKPRGRKFLDRFLQTITSLRPAVKIDALTGEPTLEIGLGNVSSVDATLDEIFAYLNTADKPCIVAFDEFQQISHYTEKNMEALLRTQIQHCPNARFIFAGSEPSLLVDMFNSENRPFYQSTFTLHLESIPSDKYIEFVQMHFREHGKAIDVALVEVAYQKFEGITLYLQMLMNEVFLLTEKGETATPYYFEMALTSLIRKQNFIYQSIFADLTERQREILRAIAAENIAVNVTSGEFVRRYHLKSPSSVQSALKGLSGKGVVGKTLDGYVINDRLFKFWIKRNSI
nr:ATP-binding protein [Bacteroides oleiciplenus]